MKTDKQYLRAREELSHIPKETLVSEMKKRNITDVMRQKFLEGKLSIGSGKDPKSGQTCPVC